MVARTGEPVSQFTNSVTIRPSLERLREFSNSIRFKLSIRNQFNSIQIWDFPRKGSPWELWSSRPVHSAQNFAANNFAMTFLFFDRGQIWFFSRKGSPWELWSSRPVHFAQNFSANPTMGSFFFQLPPRETCFFMFPCSFLLVFRFYYALRGPDGP